jgi:CBS domain-containing protein
MEQSYLALPASISLLQAGKTMLENKCHTALVLDEAEQLIGVVALADIRRALLEADSESSPSNGIAKPSRIFVPQRFSMPTKMSRYGKP